MGTVTWERRGKPPNITKFEEEVPGAAVLLFSLTPSTVSTCFYTHSFQPLSHTFPRAYSTQLTNFTKLFVPHFQQEGWSALAYPVPVKFPVPLPRSCNGGILMFTQVRKFDGLVSVCSIRPKREGPYFPPAHNPSIPLWRLPPSPRATRMYRHHHYFELTDYCNTQLRACRTRQPVGQKSERLR